MSEAANAIRARIDAGEFEADYPDTKHMSDESRSQARKAYQLATKLGRERFQEALEQAFHLTEHKHREAAWSLAWSERHSSGYGEVLDIYESIAELMQP